MRILILFTFLLSISTTFSQRGFVSPSCFNSEGNEFSVRIVDGKTYIVSDSKDSLGSFSKDIDGNKIFTDIYEIKGCEKIKAQLLKESTNELTSINSEWYDGPVSYNENDSIFFFTNSNEGLIHGKLGIYWCKKNALGQFSNPTPFPFNSNEYSCTHPYYDQANNYLYFVADIDADSTGFDLFRVLFNKGEIGKIETLNTLNTKDDELFPLVNDGKLYFTSNRSSGMGGMDIYCSEDFQTITPLDEPINSTFDDLSIFFTTNNKGYIASNRGNNQNNGDDIYQFYIPQIQYKAPSYSADNQALITELQQLRQKLTTENDPNVLLIEKALKRIENQEKQLEKLSKQFNESTLRMMKYVDTTSQISYEEKVKLYEQVIVDNQIIDSEKQENSSTSTIVNKLISTDKSALENSENSAKSTDNKQTDSTNTRSNIVEQKTEVIDQKERNQLTSKSYKTVISKDVTTGLLTNKSLEASTLSNSEVKEYLNLKQQVQNENNRLKTEKELTQQNVIPFVTEDRNIDLKMIAEHLELSSEELKKLMAFAYPITFHFDFDKTVIKKDEEDKLNYLLELVKTLNGTIRIEGHTDDKGANEYNQRLSVKRSKKVYNYLVRFGIDKTTISLENFGETQPVADNSTDEGRALNRRVCVVLLPSKSTKQ